MISTLQRSRFACDVNRFSKAVRNYLRPGPAHLLMYLAGRFQLVRVVATRLYQACSQPTQHLPSDRTHSQLENVDVDYAVQSLKRNGFFPDLRLRPDVLAQLRHFGENAACLGNGNPDHSFTLSGKQETEKEADSKFTTGRFVNCLQRCQAIRELASDPVLLAIARAYLGAEPVAINPRMWWSFAGDWSHQQRVSEGRAFHYDLDDYRAVAFFFYLSDVEDAGSGPHVCVPGSHLRKPLHFLVSPFKSRTDAQIAAYYGADRITTVSGKAGSGFAEDLFCYHKGQDPTTTDRLLLQIRFRYRVYGNVSNE